MQHHPERVVIGLLLLLPAIVILWWTSPSWTTPSSATAYYSVLAFLCVTMTVSAANKTRLDPSPSNNMLYATTAYASIIFAGAAIFYIISAETPVIHAQPSGIFLNLVALATTGIMMLLYTVLDGLVKKEKSFWHQGFMPLIFVAVSIVIFVLCMIGARQPFDETIFLVGGYVVGAVAVFTYILAAVFAFRQRATLYANDPIRLAVAFLLFAAAAVNHMLILPGPTSQWIISIGLMGLAFLFANVAISYTFLLDIGIQNRIAYLLTLGTSILAILPFIMAHLINIIMTASPIVDIGATIVIHFGGIFLAGVSAVGLYVKAKEGRTPDQLAIVFMLVWWSVCEFALILSHFSPVYGFGSESLVPYISGGIVAALTLFIAVRRVLNPTKRMFGTIARLYAVGIILAPLFIIGSEYIRSEIVLGVLGLSEGVIGAAMMLALSYLSLYALLMYITLRAGASGGIFGIDTIGAGLSTIWVIVVILKANFGYATPGWWVAEIIMLVSTASFSIILLTVYLVESQRSERLVPRVVAYSKLLSETIVYHQKTAIDSLSQMTMESEIDEAKLDSIATILTDISRANEHAKYLDTVISGERFHENDLEPMYLRDAIDLALSRSNIPDTVRWKGEEKEEVHTCLVMANHLLIDLFYNIFQGITKRIGTLEFAEVDLCNDIDESSPLCKIVLDMIVRVDDVDEVLGLLRRYMTHSPLDVIEFAYMKRLTELFGGSIEWKTDVSSRESIFLTMIVGLPRADHEAT